MTFAIFNDIKRIVRSSRLETESVTTVFGDIKLDLTRAPLEAGDHRLRVSTVFGDVKLRIPEHAGVDLDMMGVFGELEIEDMRTGDEEKPGSNWTSERFDLAQLRLHIQAQTVFGDVEVTIVPSTEVPAQPIRELNAGQEYPEIYSSYEGSTTKLPRE